MKILIDESLPRQIKQMLMGHEADTVQEVGWGGIQNGDLIAKAESIYSVFLTADKNLRYQQNMVGRTLALIIFPTNKLSVVKRLKDELDAALESIAAGKYIELPMPEEDEDQD